MSLLAALVEQLSGFLAPLFGASATAAAIVAFTMCVRLALHPMARAAVRGERVRARLAPRMAELRSRYGGDPDRLRRELASLQERERVSPLAGCLPMVLQLPVFFAMYHLFTSDDALLSHTLLGAPLGGRWLGALESGGVLGGPALVYAGLFVLVGAVATWTYVRTRRLMAESGQAHGGSGVGGSARGAVGRAAGAASARGRAGASGPGVPGAAVVRALPLLSFGTLITVAVVPLAAGLYVVTTTAWTAVERAALGAGRPEEVRGSSGDRAGWYGRTRRA